MIGARVDKIGQPNRDCVVIHLHNRGPVRRLVILAGAAPRLHFSAIPIEYPATPPMFCLLLRKHLGGGRLTGVSQQGLDRVLTLHFEATNELGDRAKFRLVCELMGRQGNLVLVGENGKVIDAIHRVDFAASESRPLLSGPFPRCSGPPFPPYWGNGRRHWPPAAAPRCCWAAKSRISPFCRKGSMRERISRRRLTPPAASCWRNFTG